MRPLPKAILAVVCGLWVAFQGGSAIALRSALADGESRQSLVRQVDPLNLATQLQRGIREGAESTAAWRSLSAEDRQRIEMHIESMAHRIASAVIEDNPVWLERVAREQYLELMRQFPGWHQMTPEERQLQDVRAEQSAQEFVRHLQPMVGAAQNSVEDRRPTVQLINYIELGLGIVWVVLGVRVLYGVLGSISWMYWLGWASIAWVLFQYWLTRSAMMGMFEQFHSQLAGSSPIPIHPIAISIGALITTLKRAFLLLVCAGMNVWSGNRAVAGFE